MRADLTVGLRPESDGMSAAPETIMGLQLGSADWQHVCRLYLTGGYIAAKYLAVGTVYVCARLHSVADDHLRRAGNFSSLHTF